MTVHKTAYDTTACSGFVIHKTVNELEKACISGWLSYIDGTNIRRIENDSPSIPAFAHPMLAMNHTNKEEFLSVDLRGYGKFDPHQSVFVVRNEIEYRQAIRRAELNYIWVKDDPKLLRDISPLPLAVYSSWVSEAVAKRYALDPREQLNLAILAAIFYNCQFSNNQEPNEHEKMRMVNAITRALRASAQDVLTIVDKFPHIANVTEFCAAAYEATASVRLKELNVGMLFSIVGNTWFGGTNAKELVAVALEHPPTWLTILLSAYSERSFKNSTITKITERSGNKDAGKDYVRSILNMIEVKKH